MRLNYIFLDELLARIEGGLVGGIGEEDNSGEAIQQVGLLKGWGKFTSLVPKTKVCKYGRHVRLVQHSLWDS